MVNGLHIISKDGNWGSEGSILMLAKLDQAERRTSTSRVMVFPVKVFTLDRRLPLGIQYHGGTYSLVVSLGWKVTVPSWFMVGDISLQPHGQNPAVRQPVWANHVLSPWPKHAQIACKSLMIPFLKLVPSAQLTHFTAFQIRDLG